MDKNSPLMILMPLGAFALCYSPADEGGAGGGGGDAGGGDGGAGGDGADGGDPGTGILDGGNPDDQGGGAPDGGGDGADPDDKNGGDGDSDGDGNDGENPEPFALDVPEGMEAFADDFTAYTNDAQSWLAENPDASAADALKWAASRQAEAVKGQIEASQESFKKQVVEWETALSTDAEVGGTKFDENKAVAVKAVQAFGDKELTELLTETGLGSHPALVKAFWRVGKHLSEAPVLSGGDGGGKKSFAGALYGKKS